ncbi:hypothetical protein [Allohahella sp. A8]|uniref:hypothetical protein n=1 Tax=Allohahella sp. A8 TaxID=3141461 RepID=UPI003A7FBABC
MARSWRVDLSRYGSIALTTNPMDVLIESPKSHSPGSVNGDASALGHGIWTKPSQCRAKNSCFDLRHQSAQQAHQPE